jgi:sporulation protein YlmC with PRC-barrel domain
MRRFSMQEERGLVGMEARSPDGTEIGRILELLTDEESGEVTHAIVENGEERIEAPISSISLDPDADFATFHADGSDEEPGDHVGDEERPEIYAPRASDAEDTRHEGQFVTEPGDSEDAQSPEDLVREDWEDEASTPVDSGYPRTDAYVDPETGETEVDPAMKDNETPADDVEDLLDGTGLGVRAVKDGVVELTGAAATREDLDESAEEIMGLDGIQEVDTTGVEVG